MPPDGTHSVQRLLRQLREKDPILVDELERLLSRTGQVLPDPSEDVLLRHYDQAPYQNPNNDDSSWFLVERFDKGDTDRQGKSRTDVENANGDPIAATFQMGDLSAWVKWDGCMELNERERLGPGKYQSSHITHICNIDGWIKALERLKAAAASHFRSDGHYWQATHEQLQPDEPPFYSLETYEGEVELAVEVGDGWNTFRSRPIRTKPPAHFTFTNAPTNEQLPHARLSLRREDARPPFSSSYDALINRARPLPTFDFRVLSPNSRNPNTVITVLGARVVSIKERDGVITYELAHTSINQQG